MTIAMTAIIKINDDRITNILVIIIASLMHMGSLNLAPYINILIFLSLSLSVSIIVVIITKFCGYESWASLERDLGVKSVV